MTRRSLAAITLSGLIAGLSPASADSPAVPPSVAKPSTSATSDMPPRTRMALKMAGLVTFVANSCPSLKPDYVRFRNALGALGFATEDLAKPDLKAEYLGYAAQYQRDVASSCERARLQFGPKGTTISDLFMVNAAAPVPAPK